MTISGQGSESSAGPPAETGPGGAVPENEQELRQEIEQTRERLGDTVELLVAKTDIKGRAQAKVAGLAGRVKGKSAPARPQSTDPAADARSQVASKSLMATAMKGADTARQGWVPLAAAAALLALGSAYSGYLAVRPPRGR